MDTQKVVLITGTSTGIGRLMAETCARKGYAVFASMRSIDGRNAAHSAALRTLAEAEGLSLHVVELDVTDDASVEHAVQEVLQEAGRIDVLIHNAGVSYVGLTETFTPEQVQRLFEVNFFGAIRMNRAVLPHMRHQGNGLLVYISSGAGRLVFPHNGLYCASKYALEALAESYHYQLFGLGIDSVIIEPMIYRSALASNWAAPADPARGAEYGQVAEIIGKLVSDISRSISNGPSPQELADAVVEFIAMPPEARPLRVPIGMGATALLTPINQVTAHAQTTVAERFGFTGLMKSSSRKAVDG
jgi:NAD(P)-dependent dehydrogenase (short-subunit alcohol dehydrogenase family)